MLQQDWDELCRLIAMRGNITHTVHIHYKKRLIVSIFIIMFYILLLQIGSFFASGLLNSLIPDALVGWKKLLLYAGSFLMLSSFMIVIFLVWWLKYIKMLFHKGPAYIISREGIMDCRFGLIPWRQIAEIEKNDFIVLQNRSWRYYVDMPHMRIFLQHPDLQHPEHHFKGTLRSFFGMPLISFFVILVTCQYFENDNDPIKSKSL